MGEANKTKVITDVETLCKAFMSQRFRDLGREGGKKASGAKKRQSAAHYERLAQMKREEAEKRNAMQVSGAQG